MQLTLPTRRKITGFHVIRSSAKDEAVDEILLEYKDEISLDTSNPNTPYVSLLKKKIAALESALQTAREEAYQAGYEEGQEFAQNEAQRQMEDLALEFTSMADSLKDQYDQSLEKMHQPLLKLAIKIAEKIIGKELQHEQEYHDLLLRRIKDLLQEVVEQNKIIIHVNPNQMDWVTQQNVIRELHLPSQADLHFIKNENLNAGECLLETEDFILEGVLSRELLEIEHQILEDEKRWKN